MKQKAIICDIDGVLLDTSHIFDRIEKAGLTGDAKWEFFDRHANDHDVEVDYRVIEILEAFANQGFKIIFLTARTRGIEKQTRAKIQLEIGRYAEQIFDFELMMRPIGNTMPADRLKDSWLEMIRIRYDVLMAIDDETANCEMFAKNKVLTTQVIKRKRAESESGSVLV